MYNNCKAHKEGFLLKLDIIIGLKYERQHFTDVMMV